MKTYVIQVTRIVTETYREEVTVRALDADEAMCKASDKLTDIIASGKCDLHYNEDDDHDIIEVK